MCSPVRAPSPFGGKMKKERTPRRDRSRSRQTCLPGPAGVHGVHDILRTPMPRWEDTIIEDYIDLGPLQASDAVREITGSAIRPVAGRMMRRSSMCCATVSRSAGLAALFGERRFAVFDMGEGHIQDIPYFEAIRRQLDQGEMSVLASLMLFLGRVQALQSQALLLRRVFLAADRIDRLGPRSRLRLQ